ncbi:flagellin N-terminal helical domain-containing protein, partial [Exiguobacterium aestuarii]
GLDMASKNAQDGISLIQTAEGALNETHDILQRMRELTVQAGNEGTNAPEDLDAIKSEMDQLIAEIDGIGDRTQFNGKTLLDGSQASGTGDLVFQIGANNGQKLTLNIDSMKAADLGTTVAVSDLDVTDFTTNTFDDQLTGIDEAIQSVSDQRSSLGANQNRLEHTIKNLENASENLTAAESRIRDVDMAK